MCSSCSEHGDMYMWISKRPVPRLNIFHTIGLLYHIFLVLRRGLRRVIYRSHTHRLWVGLPLGVKFNVFFFSVVSSSVCTLSPSTEGLMGKWVSEREREVRCTWSGKLVCHVVGRTCYLPSSFEQQKPCEGPITGTRSRIKYVRTRFVNPEKWRPWTDLAFSGTQRSYS
jgi:hypothetical protein